MKLDLRFTLCAFAIFFASGSLQAQIWNNYVCEFKISPYSTLSQGPMNSELAPVQFLNFAGAADPDDGIASDIPVGFTFDYNGNMYTRVNICVNGWASLGIQQPLPTMTNDNAYLFLQNRPNNVLAPLWGDHFYQKDPNRKFNSSISYNTTAFPDTNSNAFPGLLHVFTVEWKNLIVNSKTDTTSIPTFQLQIIENPLAHDQTHPDHRAIIEFHYDTLTASAIGKTRGCTVGINDSLGTSHMNGLFAASFANRDSTPVSTDSTTNSWPPATFLTNGVIVFRPHSSKAGVASANGSSTIHPSNYPNPFTKSTTISFTISERTFTTLKIFDALGNQIAILANKILEPGKYDIPFDASSLANGMYFYRLEAGDFSETGEMVLMR